MFEAQDGHLRSPGGHEFGLVGSFYGQPVPSIITFFWDCTAVVLDQYGRPIKGILMPDGKSVLFADRPPKANQDGIIYPRPEFATHQQVIEALYAENVDWLSYEVRWRDRGGNLKTHAKLTRDQAYARQAGLAREGLLTAQVVRSLTVAGWPQLPYEMLKAVPDLPEVEEAQLRKIRDPELRRASLRVWREAREAVERESQAALMED